MFQRILSSGAVLVVGVIVAGCATSHSPSSLNPLTAFSSGSRNDGSREKQTSPDLAFNDKKPEMTGSGAIAMARLAERRGQTQQARQLFERLLERDPNNPVLNHRLGVIHAREGRFELADASFARALALKPQDPEILCDLGYSYYLQDRLDEAQSVLEKALELEPYDEAACNNLALIYGEQGRYDLCLAAFRRTCREAEAYANLGFVYAQQGDLENAKEMYSRALTMDKNLRPAAEALVQLGQVESRRREFNQLAARSRGPLSHPQADYAGVGNLPPTPPGPPMPPPQIGQVSFQTDALPPGAEPPGEAVVIP